MLRRKSTNKTTALITILAPNSIPFCVIAFLFVLKDSGHHVHSFVSGTARMAVKRSVPLPKISTLLSHANLATTQKYLNLALDIEQTVSGFIPLA